MDKIKKKISVILAVAAAGCLAAGGFLAVKNYREARETERVLEALRASALAVEDSQESAVGEPSGSESSGEKPEPSEAEPGEGTSLTEEKPTESELPVSEPKPSLQPNPYRESFLANEDMAGWLVIPDTVIDYPVMWTPRDEKYYLYRDFEGKENQNGSLILDTDSSLDPITTNLIIHGHNMRSGAMFGNLTDYESRDFYEEHRQISLYTEECRRNYEVIAVFRSQVYRKTDEVFKFYKFFQADTQEEFDDFYQNIKELSLYDTGVTAQFGDRFLTLSTCVYHVEQGRFVVVAKETEPGEAYLPVAEEPRAQ